MSNISPTMRSWTALVMYINQIGVLSRPEKHQWTRSDQQEIFRFFLTKERLWASWKEILKWMDNVSRIFYVHVYNLIFGISVSLGCTLGTFHFKPNFEKDETNKNIEIDSKQFSEQKLRRKYLHWELKYFTKNCVF